MASFNPDHRRAARSPWSRWGRIGLLAWLVIGQPILIAPLFGAEGEDPETGKVDGGPQRTGLRLPRFASLVSNKVNLRRGPGKIYPIDWVFIRKGLPVEIIDEWELWRKIRDSDGAAGWVHKSMLSGNRTAQIQGDIRTIYRRAEVTSGAIARAEPGVIGKLLGCHGGWCRIDLGEARGWVPREGIWGAYYDEDFE